MGAIRDVLHGLQNIERQLAAIRARADAQRRKIRFHRRALERRDALIEEKHVAIREQQMEIDRIDLDVKTREEALGRHREALNRTKTNKEYAAILTAINTEKADNTKLESRQLQVMTELDERRAEVAADAAERTRLADRAAAAESNLKVFLDDNAAEVQRLERERETASQDVPQSVLATFSRIASKNEGEAMAKVALLNAKRNEHTCGGCNMAVTLETVLLLRTRDDLQICASCGMILFVNDDGRAKPQRS